MTQEEKAKAYDEALEIAKKNYVTAQDLSEGYQIDVECFKNTLESIFPELKESEDERIKKEIIDYIKTGIYHKKWIAWLEKQGNKPQGKSALEAIREEKVDNVNKIEPKDYSSIDPYFGKPIDKVGPKFHEGEWVVSKLDRKARQISEVHFDEYNSYYVVDGKEFNLEEYDRLHHSWTIKDAKDGDVLATEHGILIGIVKVKNNMQVNAYCLIDDSGCFRINSAYGFDRLATEEEKQKLFNIIKANGYKWNAETKTLEKLTIPKFKVGDKVRNKNYKDYIYDILEITDKGYKAKEINADSPIMILFGSQETNYELVPNKFDITTFKPFKSEENPMSRSKAKFATIHDLQGHISDCTLTKRDLEFIVRGLRTLDKSKFTERDLKEHESLTLYFSHLTYGK